MTSIKLLASSSGVRLTFKSGAPCKPRRAAIVVRSDASSKVLDLIKRDKKSGQVVEPSAFDDAPATGSQPAASNTAASSAPAEKSAPKEAAAGGPQRCRDAIDLGLAKFQAGEFQAAVDLFELALELPGSGFMRMSGSVREYSCPSEGEENSALYNMACCYARMGQAAPALTCLEALLDNNFEDYAAIRTDPDLATIRGPELDRLLSKHDNPLNKVLGKKKKLEDDRNKPWILW